MSMPVNDVYSLLLFEEGQRLFVYDDHNGKPITKGYTVIGNPSIGVGRSLNIRGITQTESDNLLTDDVQMWTQDLSAYSWFNELDKVRQAAIVDMAHAMGKDGVMAFHDMIAALATGSWQQAHDAVLASKWASEEAQRAKRVSLMLQTGSWPAV